MSRVSEFKEIIIKKYLTFMLNSVNILVYGIPYIVTNVFSATF